MNEYHYIQSEPGLWTVGTGTPGKGGNWNPESDWVSPDEAAKRVRFLNGGDDDTNKDVVISNLLEALEAALQQLYRTDDECGHPGKLYEQIESAITKAKGAQS